ncbi:Uncharacterised protein [Burkholderia pseudomallei]|nr:Uncharacterised protein [Burkholderia pseudomallei]CAJ7521996.1 Uncharacterised protein [Burkholderia pseudomallei]
MGPELPAAALARDRGGVAKRPPRPADADLPRIEPRDPSDPGLFPAGHRRNPDRHDRDPRSGARVHGHRDARQRRQGEALSRRRAPLLALPDRAPDRNRVLAHGAAAVGRRDRDRPHRGARRDRRELGARDQGRGHRGNGDPHEPRGGRRSRPPVTSARPGRPDRDRLHRHGIGQEPARSRAAPEGRAQARPRARADGQDLALRPDGAVAPAPAPGPVRRQPRHLPALQRHGPHPRHRIVRAASAADHSGRSDEGEHRGDPLSGARRGDGLPAQRKAPGNQQDRIALQGRRRADSEQAPRYAALQARAPASRRCAPRRSARIMEDGRGSRPRARGGNRLQQARRGNEAAPGSGRQGHHARAAGAEPRAAAPERAGSGGARGRRARERRRFHEMAEGPVRRAAGCGARTGARRAGNGCASGARARGAW